MDTLTHLALGACIGTAFSPRHHTERFMLTGALVQVVPDLDVVVNLWMEPEAALMAHRGFTHSLLFALLFSLFSSAWLPHSKSLDRSPGFWMVFLLVQLLVHDFLDAFNAYGTALFIPFSFERVSFHALYVVDPIFSVVPGMAVVLMLLFRKIERIRILVPTLALLWCTLYLLFSIWLKYTVDTHVRSSAFIRSGEISQFISTPMPFTNLNWYLVGEGRDGFYVGYQSVLDRVGDTEFTFFPRGDSLLTSFAHRPEVDILKRFSDGWYTVSVANDTTAFNILRFGRHRDQEGEFVLRYFLNEGMNNHGRLVKGRTRM